VLARVEGEREVDLADYFTGYRTSVRHDRELIRAIRIPLPLARLTAFHKIAKRRFDDISSVAVGFAIDHDDAGIVQRARIGLGGVAATPVRATATETALIDKAWSHETVAEAAEILGAEGTPINDHRASTRYRAAMLRSSLLKLHADNPNGGSQ
jgi:xanthine dehydrogenase small subunit